ncbi:hypothetical protein [Clostridium algidicarnis]|uniref:hypothetical protein n=1 Tax=Clostridium algidicarnis TaxID=37659 RepID=UPI001C0CAB10|nr:hypothetical protein [Clostridium algidicarnis]MBU3209039.1 hypothetical protein [Clostridium algidicarnis]MBU3228761.1 hypothetical protein [Clostridium algidicarnis]MBU3252305.1 hypothetical protein [Clostridium algidicarnis]
MRKKLLKRFSYLYTGELLSAVMFIILLFLFNKDFTRLQLYSLTSFWISFFLLEFLLLQGSIYWYEKWKKLKKENTIVTSIQIVKNFKNLKKINVGVIIITMFIFTFDFLTTYSSLPLGSLIVVGFIYIFAILEYINYFHFQLMYDNFSDIKYLLRSKKLKQSCISRDFDRTF